MGREGGVRQTCFAQKVKQEYVNKKAKTRSRRRQGVESAGKPIGDAFAFFAASDCRLQLSHGSEEGICIASLVHSVFFSLGMSWPEYVRGVGWRHLNLAPW